MVGSRRTARAEVVERSGALVGWEADVSSSLMGTAAEPRLHAMTTLSVTGEFDEALAGVRRFEVDISPAGPAPPDWTPRGAGVWTAVKPAFSGAVYLPSQQFDLVQAMAISGKLRWASFNFEQPKYGSSRILLAWFSSRPDGG